LFLSKGPKVTFDRIDQTANPTNFLFSVRNPVVIRGQFQCGLSVSDLSTFGELWMMALAELFAAQNDN
jgi:hypothetical protein